MIKLESSKMTKAIETAKTVKPRVRFTGTERVYEVSGRKGDTYTVRFAVVNGHKLAECTCPARGLCYHIASAAALNIAIHSQYSRETEAAPVVAPSPKAEREQSILIRPNTQPTFRCEGWAV
jgi:uncharacterized Zn finger protein